VSPIWALPLLAGLARAEPWEPGPWPAPAPGVSTAAPAAPPQTDLLSRLYRWYRARSAEDGGHCPYFPTCSGYGRRAVQERGLPLGTLLTVDRLLREYPGMDAVDHYPLVTPYGVPRLHDPVPPRPERRRDRRGT
jgi:putative component of membrane protein insertase Oxa1/YidC/SpoIIIJ protein YidD